MALDGDSLISFERDDLHRAVTRHQQGQQTQLRYDPVGRLLAQEVFQTGPETHHNRSGQRQTLSRRPTIKRQYQYTVNGLLSQVQDQQRGPTQYQYDPLGRLREALAPGQAERFDFDPASNLIDPQDAIAADSHTRATEWRADLSITGQSPQQGGTKSGPTVMGNLLKRFADTRYHYDAHGNLTRSITVGGSTWEYRYDAEHRLVEACQYAQSPAAGDSVKAQTKAEYGYDALGRRVWKQVEIDGHPPELTVFTWDGDLLQSETRFEGDIHSPVRSRPPGLIPENPRRKFPRPIAQQVHTLDASALVPTHTATYLYEPDSFIPLAQLTAGFDHTALAATGTDRQPLRCYQTQTATLYYFQTDHLGTPQDITDTEGHIVWSGQYRAWGQLAQAHNGQGEKPHVHNPFRFQGQYHDPETGLHYNRFRYYDPRIGRFTTQDPIGLMGGENLYQYAPNPTGWIDPLGLSKQCCVGGVTKNADDFFEGTYYTGKVKGQMAKNDLHSFPESVKGFQNQGTVRKITGGDGKVREQLEIPGSYYKTHKDGSKTWADGKFEFMKEEDGAINHRFFRESR